MSEPSTDDSPPNRWLALFCLDLRSLAIFRIGLGLLLLVDLLFRLRDLRAHYTDEGVLRVNELTTSWLSSLHTFSGSAWWQLLLFCIAGLVAIALILGFRTRVSTFLSFVLLLSLHNRNPLVLQGGDDLLRLLLFWSMFLPLGSYASLDRRLGWEPPPPNPRVVSVATAGFLLQLCFVYWFAFVHKSDPAWRSEGTAVYYALNVDAFTTRLGQYLSSWPDEVLRTLTFSTLILEAIGPILLFIPFRSGMNRTLVVLLFVGFHLFGLGLALELGPFPYICSLAWLPVLPGSFWQRWSWSRGAEDKSLWFYQPLGLELIASVALVYVFMHNLYTTTPDRFGRVMPPAIRGVGEMAGLHQSWNMFAPKPLTRDGWFVTVGVYEDDTRIDPFRGTEVSWRKPALVSESYRNQRWRKYLMNMTLSHNKHQAPRFARYLFENGNASLAEGKRMRSVEVYFMLEITSPDRSYVLPEKFLLAVWPPEPQPESLPGE